MDEITLVNLLNKICDKNDDLTWKLNCQYEDGANHSIMKINLIRISSKAEISEITFQMETGQIITGQHLGLIPFKRSSQLVDALLDILIFESGKLAISPN